MKVLLIGSGGREHALAWKLARSPLLEKLFIAPGNAGTALHGENVALDVSDHPAMKDFVLENGIGMLVVGPEAPLVEGIHDFFLRDPELRHVTVIGPARDAAMLEGSKDFAKDFMNRHGIPTAAHATFEKDTLEEGLSYLETLEPPYVLKADGLAAGKGVLIISDLAVAKKELGAMLRDEKFGEAGRKVVVEEFLSGIEISCFVLTDGQSYLLLPSAKDYKRIGEGDTGLNTGGMGSISPVPFAGEAFMQKVEQRIIAPTIHGLAAEGISYRGFIFFGLIKVDGDPYVIEYNVRMGDPEAESVIPRIRSDLLQHFIALGEGRLGDERIETDPHYSAAVMLVSAGYPESYEKGKPISGLDDAAGSIIFHAGTKADGSGQVFTNGGRVIALTSLDETLQGALERSYRLAAKVSFEGKYYRRDLGHDLL